VALADLAQDLGVARQLPRLVAARAWLLLVRAGRRQSYHPSLVDDEEAHISASSKGPTTQRMAVMVRASLGLLLGRERTAGSFPLFALLIVKAFIPLVVSRLVRAPQRRPTVADRAVNFRLRLWFGEAVVR